MIKYLKHEQINKNSWDACIGNSNNRFIYAYSWYLDMVSPGWEALVYEDYKMVMPLTCRSKWGINYLYQPCFVQQLGVFSSIKLNDEKIKSFLEAIPSKYKLIEIKLNYLNKCEGGYLSNRNLELLLNNKHEQLKLSYSENTKRNIKKAKKQGVIINQNVASLKDIITIFDLSRKGKSNGCSEKDYEVLLRLHELLKNRGEAILLSAHDTSSLLGGVLFFIKDNRAILIFSGVNDEGRKVGAMHFLIDHFIHQFADSSLILDFEGSNDENLARFYKGFGSIENNYPTYRLNKLPFFIRWMKK